MKAFLLICLISMVFTAMGQQPPIKKEKWHFENPLKQDTSAGYAQVVKIDNILYISGTVSTNITAEAITSLYRILGASLKSFGAGFQNVVKENLYTTDIEMVKKYNSARKAFYQNDFPAATWVQISRLYMPEAKLEVELVAHLPK
jgi:2-iminobutanoate/2-iminopropanoate deaminase